MSSDDASGTSAPVCADAGLLSPVSARTMSAASDSVIVARMVDVELALLHAFADAGLAPDSVARVAEAVTSQPPAMDVSALARDAVATGNPVVPMLTHLRGRVAEVDSAAVFWVHRGATSQDVVDSALMLVVRDVAAEISPRVAASVEALAALAERHRDDPAAARTLTQHAVPTTLGFRAARWALAISEAGERLADEAARLPAQLGGAGGTLASFVALFGGDRTRGLVEAYAARLGLAAPERPWHTERAPVIRIAAALGELVAALGAFASDVAQLTRTEVGEALVAAGGGSSAMPHKANPVDAVLVRSAAMRAPGLVSTLQLAAGLEADERADGAWHAEWPALQELLRVALGAADRAAALAQGLRLDPSRARSNLDLTGAAIVSERLALEVKPLIGGDRFSELLAHIGSPAALADALRTLPEVRELDVDDLLDPARYVGIAPHETDRILARLRSRTA